jgi:hypothetical protein
MLAILSMDAYDQGYGAGIGGVGRTIGNAKFQFDSSVLDTPGNTDVAQSVGFYAAAYFYAGQTIVAYRGTVPIRLTQTPTRASVGHHGGHGHPAARRSCFSPIAPRVSAAISR